MKIDDIGKKYYFNRELKEVMSFDDPDDRYYTFKVQDCDTYIFRCRDLIGDFMISQHCVSMELSAETNMHLDASICDGLEYAINVRRGIWDPAE